MKISKLSTAKIFAKENEWTKLRTLLRVEIAKDWHKCQSTADHHKFFEEVLGVADKESYLNFRSEYKQLINLMSAHQKALAARMHMPGGDSSAQMFKEYFASYITTLIEIRRAGKTWSAAQAKLNREAA